MQLKLGKMTSTELGLWFRVAAGTIRNNKDKYYNILARYCKFHEEGDKRKTLYIDEIYEAEFSALQGPKPFQRVKELTKQNWSSDGLDSCAKVANKNYPLLREEGYQLTEGTNYTYTCKSRTELWGSPMKLTSGELGQCRYEYCKIINGELVPFTIEEQEIKRQITEKYFGRLEDFTLGILDDLQSGKITKEEAGDALTNLTLHGDYWAWKHELMKALNCEIYKATRIIGRNLAQPGDFIWEEKGAD